MSDTESLLSCILRKKISGTVVEVNQINLDSITPLIKDLKEFLMGDDLKFFLTGLSLCREALDITYLCCDYLQNLLLICDYLAQIKQPKGLIKAPILAAFLFNIRNENLLGQLNGIQQNYQPQQKTMINISNISRLIRSVSGEYEFYQQKQIIPENLTISLNFDFITRYIDQNAEQAAEVGLSPTLIASNKKLDSFFLSPKLLLLKLFKSPYFETEGFLSTYVLRTSLNFIDKTNLIQQYRPVVFKDQQLVQIYINTKNKLCVYQDFKVLQNNFIDSLVGLRKSQEWEKLLQQFAPFISIYNYFNEGDLLCVPLNLSMNTDQITDLIASNFQMNYVLQFQLNNIVCQHVIKCNLFDQLLSQKKLRDITKETLDSFQQNIFNYVESCCPDMIVPIFTLSSPFVQLIFYNLIQETNELSEEINCCLSLIRNGFLNLEHPTLSSFIRYEMDQSDIYKFDRNMSWEVLLEVLLVIHKKGQAINIKDLIKQFPKFQSFQQSIQTGVSCITSADVEVTKTNAKHKLLTLIHELQHIRHSHYKAVMNPENSVLVQVLADTTSISPLTSAIHFEIKGQLGVDAGGIWRQVLGIVFDELIAEVEVTQERLQLAKTDSKFGKRELDFHRLNGRNPHAPTLLKAATILKSQILVPHFNFYKPTASGDVYPRLTDKRSCVYYLGRLMAYCLSVGGKMPNFFCDNFWKCLTKGRLFFDEAMERTYAAEIAQNSMFKVNGTLPQNNLEFVLTDEEIENYYPEYIMMFKSVISGEIDDIDMLNLHDSAIREIEKAGFKVTTKKQDLPRYASQMIVDMKSGAAFMKTYAEIRNGFRHPFSTSMLANDHEGTRFYAQWLDKCFEVIDYKDLIELITFDPQCEEFVDRDEVVQQLIDRNVVNTALQSKEKDSKLKVIQVIKEILMDKKLYPHEQFMDFIQAVTGARHLANQQINLMFYNQIQRHLAVFHTCFSQIDLPLQYVASLTKEQLATYLKECVILALKSGFQIA